MAENVCPWYLGFFLISPLRKMVHNPDKIVGNYLKKNMAALDIGSGTGFFNIPMAQKTGDSGKIIAVDLQHKMLVNLKKMGYF